MGDFPAIFDPNVLPPEPVQRPSVPWSFHRYWPDAKMGSRSSPGGREKLQETSEFEAKKMQDTWDFLWFSLQHVYWSRGVHCRKTRTIRELGSWSVTNPLVEFTRMLMGQTSAALRRGLLTLPKKKSRRKPSGEGIRYKTLQNYKLEQVDVAA